MAAEGGGKRAYAQCALSEKTAFKAIPKNFGGHTVMQMLYSSQYLTTRSVM